MKLRWSREDVRGILERGYRIVYRVLENEVHILSYSPIRLLMFCSTCQCAARAKQ